MILQLSGAFKQQKTKQPEEDLCIHASMHPYIHASIHPSIHSSIHAPINTRINTLIHTYMHTYIHTSRHTCMLACIHTCTKKNKHTYIHTYIHTCMHTCIHAYAYLSCAPSTGKQVPVRVKATHEAGGDSVHRSRVIDTGGSRPDSDLHLHQCMRHPI